MSVLPDAYDLGAYPEYFGQGDIHLGVKESTADTAKVLGRMYDGIEFRGFHQKDVESLAENANVPVWNIPNRYICILC